MKSSPSTALPGSHINGWMSGYLVVQLAAFIYYHRKSHSRCFHKNLRARPSSDALKVCSQRTLIEFYVCQGNRKEQVLDMTEVKWSVLVCIKCFNLSSKALGLYDCTSLKYRNERKERELEILEAEPNINTYTHAATPHTSSSPWGDTPHLPILLIHLSLCLTTHTLSSPSLSQVLSLLPYFSQTHPSHSSSSTSFFFSSLSGGCEGLFASTTG